MSDAKRSDAKRTTLKVAGGITAAVVAIAGGLLTAEILGLKKVEPYAGESSGTAFSLKSYIEENIDTSKVQLKAPESTGEVKASVSEAASVEDAIENGGLTATGRGFKTQFTLVDKERFDSMGFDEHGVSIAELYDLDIVSVIATFENVTPLYEGTPESPYYVGLVDTTQFNETGYIVNSVFTNGDNTNPVLLSDRIVYDMERGIVYVPKDLLEDEELFAPTQSGLTGQFMVMYSWDNDTSKISVSVDNNNSYVTALAEHAEYDVAAMDTLVTIPITTPETADKIDLSDLEISINEQPIDVENGQDDLYYDADTGELVILEPPVSLSSVSVSIAERGLLDQLLPRANAVDPDNMRQYNWTDGIDLSTAKAGALYKYSGQSHSDVSMSTGYFNNDDAYYMYGAGTSTNSWSGPGAWSKIGNENGTCTMSTLWDAGYNVDVSGRQQAMGCVEYPYTTCYKVYGSGASSLDLDTGITWHANHRGYYYLPTTCCNAESWSGGYDWWMPNRGNVYMRILYLTDTYAVLGFISPWVNDTQQMGGVFRFKVLSKGTLKINKLSMNGWQTAHNANYTNLSSTWKVYSNSACTTLAGTVTTNSDGVGQIGGLEPGTYWVKETAAPPNYTALADPIKIQIKAGTNYLTNAMTAGNSGEFVHDTYKSVSLKVNKVLTGTTEPVEGVVFGVWTGGYDNSSMGISGYSDAQDDVGVNVNLSTYRGSYFINTALGPSMSLDVEGASTTNGANIELWQSNRGYAQRFRFDKYDSTYYYIVNTRSGKVIDAEGGSTSAGTNLIQWTKNGGDNQLWKIVDNGDGTVTFINKKSGLPMDINGADYANGTNITLWTSNGNANQKWKLRRADTFIGTMTTNSNGVATMSTIPGTTEPLPIANYYVKELSVPEDSDLIFDADRVYTLNPNNNYTVTVENTPEVQPAITSKLSVVDSTVDPIVFKDVVTYKDFDPGTYTFKGTLYDKATGNPFKVNGVAVTGTATATVTSAKPNGSVTVQFEVDADELPMGSTTLVAFQTAYQGSTVIAEHNNINDTKQRVTITKTAELSTTLADADGHKDFPATGTINLIDTIRYTVPTKNVQYKIVATLIDASTGNQLAGTSQITKTFTPTARTGTTTLAINNLNIANLAGKSVVLYEKLYREDDVIAVHEDIDDDGQTVYFPKVSTNALDKNTQLHMSSSVSTANTITDTVSFSGIQPNVTYKAKAWLVHSDTGEAIEGTTVEKTFSSKTETGTTTMSIPVNGTDLVNKKVVVFEELYHGSRLMAEHKSLTDSKQTVRFPKVSTVLTGPNGAKTVPSVGTVTLTDTITYSNLIPNVEYTLIGTLMNKSTNATLAGSQTVEKTFTPTSASGTVDVTFTVDTSRLSGMTTAVAYERLMYDGRIMAAHRSITSEAQTVVLARWGDIEVVKYDATSDTSSPQGDAALEGVEFDIINRTGRTITSPVDGTTQVANGKVVCTIVTKKVGNVYKASTKATDTNPKSGGGTWNTPSAWHGALEVGDYEVVEKKTSTGYLLGTWSNDNQKIWHGIATEAGTPFDTSTTVENHTAPSAPKYIKEDRDLVSFSTAASGAQNTVKRGDIEVVKYDATTGTSSPQGNASLEGVQFDIINRSNAAVVSPEDGSSLIQPGKVVCRITTKKVGNVYKASTAASGNQKKGGEGTWTTPSSWHGALAYGEYEVREVVTSTGYMKGEYNGTTQKVFCGYATVNGAYESTWLPSNGQAFKPSATPYWINNDKVLVKFSDADHGASNTVQRGNIEVVKYDENLNRSEAQGDATLAGVSFDVINRSAGPVVSPEDGTTLIQPGKVVCRITTKKVDGIYKASTAFSDTNKKKDGSDDTWNIPSGWHGALAYGEYEVKEVKASEGYQLGVYSGDTQKVFHGIAAKSATYDESWLGTNGQKFTPSSDAKWVNADKVTVAFSEAGHVAKDTVKRGDIELVKYDATTKTSAPQGNASLIGVEFDIINRSAGPVVSPEDGREVAPGKVVCRIKTYKGTYNGQTAYIASTKKTGTNPKSTGSGTWNTPSGWHGALAYGQYEVVEVTTSEGYMLGTWSGDNQSVFHGMATTSSSYDSITVNSPGKKFKPNGSPTWINADKALVKFDEQPNGASNTVMRGDIELVKYDDDFGRSEPQGDAKLAGAQFDIINRSKTSVVSPEDGTTLIEPGQVVCRITTKKDGNVYKASTAAANNQKKSGEGTWSKPSAWHGALAYGEYEVVEVGAPEGYMLGVYSSDTQKIWHGYATIQSKYDAQWLNPNGQAFKPDAEPYWINDDKVVVQFDDVDHGPHDTVKRGDVELVKYDDTLKRSFAQGNATLEDIQFDIINRSAGKVISPEDGVTEIAPGEVVCRITTKYVDGAYRASTQAKGVNQKKDGSGTWDTPASWHGALAYGQYQIKEVEPSIGYMLGKWNNDTQKIWSGAVSKDGKAAASWNITATDDVYASDGDPKWVNDDRVLVKFDEQTQGPNDTVMRGDIDVQKVDDELQRTEHATDIQDRQGMARLDGCILGVYNRSNALVVSPVDGSEIQPGELVCTITTDMDGIASTEVTPERAVINGWGANCFAIANGWHGSLAYGEYEVIEQLPSEGYLINKTWHGMAVDYTVASPKSPIIEWPAHEGAEKENIKPNTDVTWIDADKVRVSFGNKVYGDDAVNQVSWLPEQVIRGGVRIGKVDRQNQEYKAQGKATLENHVIAIYSRNLHPVLIHEISSEKSNRTAAPEVELPAWDPTSTAQSASSTTMALGTQTKDGVLVAYLNTKAVEEDGQIKYIAETDLDTLPYGIYRIKEVFVPSKSGYLFDQVSADWYEDFAIGSDFSTREFAGQNAWKLSVTNFAKDETYHTTVTQTDATNDRTYVDFTDDPKYCVSNYVLRGDVLIHKKVENADSNVLQYTPFVVVSKTTGEAHIIVTDKNGDATTMINHQASTLQNDDTGEVLGYTLHTFETDKNDEGVLALAEGTTIPALAKDETTENGFADIETLVSVDDRGFVLDTEGNTPDFQWAYGSWFNGRIDEVTDNLRLTYQNADWITGSNYIADAEQVVVDDTVGALPFDDYIIYELKIPEHEVTDLVDGETLTVMSNEKYLMVGNGTFSVTTANGEYVNTDNPASRANREVISWHNPTQADIRSGRYPQEVDLDDQKAIVIGTQLADEEGNHLIAPDTEEVTLYDTIAYSDALPGTEYTFKGELHRIVYDAEGNRQDDGIIATSEVVFTPDMTSGTVVAEFHFAADDARGHVLVAFEYAYVEGKLITWHEDIDDDGQTVGFVEMGTTLADGPDGDKEVAAYEPVHLVDTVAYAGLIPGKEYTVSGTLHIKNADGTDGGPLLDAEGNEIHSSTTFTPDLPDGTVEVAFDMDGSVIGGKVVVAFEDISYKGRVFIVHADINDVPQTVWSPDISTTALDGITEDHLGLAEGEITLNDIVAYSNLEKGRSYTIDGTLMDRLTGEAIQFAEGDVVKGTKTFIAGYNDDGTPDETVTITHVGDVELVSGIVEVPFHPNAEDIKGKATVVFEKLYGGDKPDEPKEGKDVEISKTDATTGEELPGALLIITKDGEEIEKWVSEETPHTVKLEEGTYELTEITAPKGYEVAETIEFTVDENGLVDSDKVEMKDQPVDVPEGEHEVEISKTDATTSEELPGATIVIVQDGVTIDEWVSEDTPHTVKLDEGTYELIEITAPDGYNVAETIEFTVGPDGLVDSEKVEMKDAPVSAPEEDKPPVAIHEDINDDNQSVNYPEIRTLAHVGGAKDGVTAAGEVHLIDTVSYTNLVPGREYVMNGVLMDKVTGQPALTPDGQQVTAQTVFTPETASGTIDMEFVFNARALQYHETVVFENVYAVKSGVADEFIHVARHEDINDAAQTVGFGEDDLADELITATGDETANLIAVIAAAVAALGGTVAVRRRQK